MKFKTNKHKEYSAQVCHRTKMHINSQKQQDRVTEKGGGKHYLKGTTLRLKTDSNAEIMKTENH